MNTESNSKVIVYLFYMQIKVEATLGASQPVQAIGLQDISLSQMRLSQLDEAKRSTQSLRPEEHQGLQTASIKICLDFVVRMLNYFIIRMLD